MSCFAFFSHSAHLEHLKGHAECIPALKACALHLRKNRLTFDASDVMKFSVFFKLRTREKKMSDGEPNKVTINKVT